MNLKTRKPSGAVPWPLVVIEGGEKAGKSWACAVLSASPKVGATYWIDLGEGSADEYGAIPGARYEIVEHDGSFAQIFHAVVEIKKEAARAAAAGEPPVVIVLDSGSAEWELLKGNADAKARARLAEKGKRLAPDKEPQISMDLWNEANAKHRKLMTQLMTFPGIAIITARGKEVASLDSNGRPIENTKEYKVEGQKNLAFDASVWIRVSRDHEPVVIGARSVHAGVRPGTDKPKPIPDFSLEKVIFEILRCNPAEAHVRDLVQPKTTAADLAETSAPIVEELRELIAQASGKDELTVAWRRLGEADAELPPGAADQLKAAWRDRKDELLPPAEDDPRIKRMFALLGKANIVDRDQRLAWFSEITGRDISTTKELTGAEVIAVTERTQRWIDQETPAEDDAAVAA